jgi:hypothetical protein
MSAVDIQAVADEALDAFWEAVARRVPDVTTGDASPELTLRLHLAAEAAIREWIASNAPGGEGSP